LGVLAVMAIVSCAPSAGAGNLMVADVHALQAKSVTINVPANHPKWQSVKPINNGYQKYQSDRCKTFEGKHVKTNQPVMMVVEEVRSTSQKSLLAEAQEVLKLGPGTGDDPKFYWFAGGDNAGTRNVLITGLLGPTLGDAFKSHFPERPCCFCVGE